MDRFQGVFQILQAAILAFLFLVTLLALLAGIGAPVPMDRAIHAGTGLLFVVLGNFMGKLTKNFFVGIRTPAAASFDSTMKNALPQDCLPAGIPRPGSSVRSDRGRSSSVLRRTGRT